MGDRSARQGFNGGSRRRSTLHATLTVLCAWLVLLAGCSSERGETSGPLDNNWGPEDAGADAAVRECIDEDGDGFGRNCKNGLDCDDSDPEITDECYHCAHEGTLGCPCDEEGARAECGQVLSKFGDQVTCGYGWSTCSEGAWGPCIINNSSAPVSKSASNLIDQALGGPSSTCKANPCDPYCQAFDNDTPSGIGGEDIVATDAGITLGEGSGPGVQDSCSGGVYGNCAHSICEPGGAPLMPGCDDNQTSCRTPTVWPSVDARMEVNPQISSERFGVYTPSWPKVEAPDRVDPVATADRYETYFPPVPQEPADETLNGPATATRFQDYTPVYPSAPANELVDDFQTGNRYNFYNPTWPTAAPEEIVDEDATGSGSQYTTPNFPWTPATKTETAAKPYEDLDPPYPPASPQVSQTQPGYERFQFPPKVPIEVPSNPSKFIWEYPVYPAEPKVEFVQAAYTNPTAGLPIAVTWTGSACGGYGTPHVTNSCTARPPATSVPTTIWTNDVRHASTGRYRSQVGASSSDGGKTTELIRAGTIVDVTMTASSGDPDLYVKALGRVVRTTHQPFNHTNTGEGAATPPTHFVVLPQTACVAGSSTAQSAISMGNYDCRPFLGGTATETCRFYFATDGQLAYMVDTEVGGAGSTSTLRITKRQMGLWYEKIRDNTRQGRGGEFRVLDFGSPPADECRETASGSHLFALPLNSVGVAVGRQRTSLGQLGLLAKLAGKPTAGSFDCAPSAGFGANQTAACILYPSGATTNTSFGLGIINRDSSTNTAYGGGSVMQVDTEVAIFYPDGNCPAGTVSNGQGGCCACAAGESSGGACGADQCGTKCPAGSLIHEDKCYTCPAGYKLNNAGTQCIWDGLSCAGAVCGAGETCKMVAGAPKCAKGCDASDSTSHACSHDANLCCGYKCNNPDYSITQTGPTTWDCKPRTNVCTPTATNSCKGIAPPNTHNCDASTNPVQCRGTCAERFPGTFPYTCAADPTQCCAHQCEAGFSHNPVTDQCEPVLTIPCTAQAAAYCQSQGATCINDGTGRAVCQKDYNCEAEYGAGFRSCNGGTQCCKYQCAAGYDYDSSTHSCKPQTAACTSLAQNACSTLGAGSTCLVIGGKAQCRKPANCPAGQFAEGEKCYQWTCSAPYNYQNAGFNPPRCEHHDCSLPDVCNDDEDEVCEDTGPRAFPNEKCRRLTGCPEPTHPCPFDENQCCSPHTCPPPGFLEHTTYNPSTELCEWKSCSAPAACNAGDTCLEMGSYADPNQQCRQDTGICGGATHLCEDSCCYFTCPPTGPSNAHLTYRNIDQCEDRSCGACGSDICQESYVDGVLCREDLGCANGTHECGPGGTQCCDYTCPPVGHPEHDHLEGTICERRNCDLCTDNGPEHQCMGTSPTVSCRKDLGCPAGTYECPDDPASCCKKSCAPPPIAGYDVLAWDERLGDACEYHGCDLCGADECLGPTADSGCKRDYGCGGGTFECGASGLECCDAICPPPGFPNHTNTVGDMCEAHDCSVCEDDEICIGSAPNVRCCSGGEGCVIKVCQQNPACCTTKWTQSCVELAKNLCNIDCVGLGSAGTCAVCYKDDKDHDGDGYSYAQGDCMDCYAEPGLTTDFINPGAFDVPGNNLDDNCNGTVDESPTACDLGLPLASSNAFDYARAMGLCEIQPPSGRWGVTSAKLVRSDATSVPGNRSFGILSNFGSNVPPLQGSNVAAFSTGAARRPGDTGFVKPKYQYNCSGGFFGGCSRGSVDWGLRSPYPQGYPRNTAGCPSPSGSANDSSGLWMQIRVPTNARSFSYNLNYYSSEYAEWVCSAYNDSFVALLTSNHSVNMGNQGAPHYRNISFDGNNSPINVNNNFFQVRDQATLAGSGFEGTNCPSGYCGAATGWLETSAPVTPGETITVHFSIWDTSDHIYDSTVLLDNWQWHAEEKPIKTLPNTPDPVVVEEGSFVRDYDASTLCADKPGTTPRWARWNWTASTPSTTRIQFFVRTADTLAGLNTAAERPLLFDSGWPASMQNQHAEAKQASTAPAYSAASSSGSTVVEHSLKTHGLPFTHPYLRIRSRLMAAPPDFAVAPTLKSWSLEVDCLPNQ